MRQFRTHGDGRFALDDFKSIGDSVIFERDVLIWHPETISLGQNVYVGHRSMIKGYPSGHIEIGDNVWIGQNVFMHGAGGITIESDVGIGPGVQMLTSSHSIPPKPQLILDASLEFAPIHIGAGSDIGVGSIVLPGVSIGQGVQIGAGTVVTKSVPDFTIVAGNPGRVLRKRD
ncbi:MAG: acyltransferase [Myxococcota bacterium]|nr:acyltransferase [Myxococcota bacterium]